MNKKGNVLAIVPMVVFFSFLSLVVLSISMIYFGLTNDYILFNMQEISIDLENKSVIPEGYADMTQERFEGFQQSPALIDDFWFAIYIIFIMLTLLFAYMTKTNNYLSSFSYLLWGIMLSLFVLSIITIITDWWTIQILNNIIPNAIEYMPKFNSWLNNVGIWTAIHLALLVLVNLLDVDINKINRRKEKELQAIDKSEEVL